MGCGFSTEESSNSASGDGGGDGNGDVGGVVIGGGAKEQAKGGSKGNEKNGGRSGGGGEGGGSQSSKKANGSLRKSAEGREPPPALSAKYVEAQLKSSSGDIPSPPPPPSTSPEVESMELSGLGQTAPTMPNSHYFGGGQTLHMQPEVSASQINFFKMLDEKIENGVELDEVREEEFRRQELLRSRAEWDNVLGKSLDHKSSSKYVFYGTEESSVSDSTNGHGPEDDDHVKNGADGADGENTRNSSVDSMRTVFSNSMSLAAGVLEMVSFGGGAGVSVPPPDASFSSASASASATARPRSALHSGERTPSRSTASATTSVTTSLESSANRSIRLSNVLQDSQEEKKDAVPAAPAAPDTPAAPAAPAATAAPAARTEGKCTS